MVAKAMVPKLRFKEGDAIREREWSRDSIGNLFNVVSGGTPSRANQEFFQNGKHAWVRTTDLNNGFITTTSECLTDIALRETSIKMLPEGTVVVAMYGGFNQIGRTGLLISPSAINQALSAILPNLDAFAPYFLLSYLNYKVDAWKEFAASSRKDPNITKEDVKSFELIFPDIKEQTKIANFLTAVDIKISQLTKKHELLTLYKKGVMQKIFNRELRFKDDEGREFPEWEDSKLFDIAPLQRGFDLPVSNIKKGKFPVVFSNGILKHHYEFKVHGPGVVTGRSGTIGKVTFVEQDFWPHNTSLWVTDFKNNVPKFIYYLYCYLDLSKFGTGSGVPTLNRNDVHRENTYVPQTQGEQTKIANFLTAIDDKITNVKSQLEAAKEYKQGLLQQMFV